MRRVGMCLLLAVWAGAVGAVELVVSNVKASQNWPWDARITVEYDLQADSSAAVDVTAAAVFAGRRVAVPQTAILSGQMYSVTAGTGRKLVIDASKLGLPNVITDDFRIELTGTLAATYMIVDLISGAVSYHYCGTNIWYGANDDVYKTDKLILRRVLPGTFQMGSPANDATRFANEDCHEVSISQPYWLGVFEVTQKQYYNLTGAWPAYYTNMVCRDTRPVESISYQTLRGIWTSSGWPCGVGSGFLKTLQQRTGLAIFDLPTEAQWEYACRAGTSTVRYNGTNPTGHPGNVGRLFLGSQYTSNNMSHPSRSNDTSYATGKVGSALPNPWGFYDMYGNVTEFCADHYQPNLGTSALVDPLTTVAYDASNWYRVDRGGGFNVGTFPQVRSALRGGGANYASTDQARGFRVWAKGN